MFLSNPGQGKITLVLSASMVIIFLGLGCVFIFTDIWIQEYPRPFRNYIGYVLSGWALFRGFTVWVKYKNIRREEDNEKL